MCILNFFNDEDNSGHFELPTFTLKNNFVYIWKYTLYIRYVYVRDLRIVDGVF